MTQGRKVPRHWGHPPTCLVARESPLEMVEDEVTGSAYYALGSAES